MEKWEESVDPYAVLYADAIGDLMRAYRSMLEDASTNALIALYKDTEEATETNTGWYVWDAMPHLRMAILNILDDRKEEEE